MFATACVAVVSGARFCLAHRGRSTGANTRVVRGSDRTTLLASFAVSGGTTAGGGSRRGGTEPRGYVDDVGRPGSTIGKAGQRSVADGSALTFNFGVAAAERVLARLAAGAFRTPVQHHAPRPQQCAADHRGAPARCARLTGAGL